jgi:methoxymalonate biosynthesis acyl carrier protein
MSIETEVRDRIARIFLDRIHLEIPSPETDLFATSALDSMAFVELLVSLEEAFGIAIPLETVEIDTFRTIDRITEFVVARTRGREAAATSGGRGH